VPFQRAVDLSGCHSGFNPDDGNRIPGLAPNLSGGIDRLPRDQKLGEPFKGGFPAVAVTETVGAITLNLVP
jgi:hypothetical protein